MYQEKIKILNIFFVDKRVKLYYTVNIGNKNKRMWFASNKEVRLMIELTLLSTIYILFFALIITTIIAFALIIALAVIISKSE